VTQYDQVQALVDAAVQAFGRIHVMINNAGLMPHSPLERRKIEDWNQTLDVNLKGARLGCDCGLRRQASSCTHCDLPHSYKAKATASSQHEPYAAIGAARETSCGGQRDIVRVLMARILRECGY
jgi:NAD(P)-dependent dehydrogenase (short-subunit alcohol dehydrogenase family)